MSTNGPASPPTFDGTVELLAREAEQAGDLERAHSIRHAREWEDLVSKMPEWARRVVAYQTHLSQEMAVRLVQLDGERAILLEGYSITETPLGYEETPDAVAERLSCPFGAATFYPTDPAWPAVRLLVPSDRDVPTRIDLLRAPLHRLVDPADPPWHLGWTTKRGSVAWTLLPHSEVKAALAG